MFSDSQIKNMEQQAVKNMGIEANKYKKYGHKDKNCGPTTQ